MPQLIWVFCNALSYRRKQTYLYQFKKKQMVHFLLSAIRIIYKELNNNVFLPNHLNNSKLNFHSRYNSERGVQIEIQDLVWETLSCALPSSSSHKDYILGTFNYCFIVICYPLWSDEPSFFFCAVVSWLLLRSAVQSEKGGKVGDFLRDGSCRDLHYTFFADSIEIREEVLLYFPSCWSQ